MLTSQNKKTDKTWLATSSKKLNFYNNQYLKLANHKMLSKIS